MQFAQRQRLSWGKGRPLLVAIGLGLLLGFLGPFGTNPGYSTATRYAFWLAMTVAGVVAAMAAERLLQPAALRSGAVRVVATAVLSAVPMTFVVAWTMAQLQSGRQFAPMQLPGLFAAVAVIQLVIVLATAWASPADARPEAAVPVEPAPPVFPHALLAKLPQGTGTQIVALETEDHYLRVHAAGGSALVLMRMADAVDAIDPRLGAQVHRRWWVSQAAVAGLETDGQRVVLRLADGRRIPVGRTFVPAVRARFGSTRA